ncbi:hypothetical protein GS966_28620 [Rhodococcus hoagii]|nr:hypothetical protein [Prescottella equi]NKS10252.1 hypothetical protein [Prescottella equi]NKS35243.1 hypothetical protein [Prescottella equi]NKS68240.1 hypothetical protein [Prescottella equi]NKW53056.1 hypothetical protein [Prescottella equi]
MSSSRFSQLRDEGIVPPPDPAHSSPRKPMWGRDAVIDTCAARGKLGDLELRALEGRPGQGRRWRVANSGVVAVETTRWGKTTMVSVHVTHYEREGNRQLSDDVASRRLFLCTVLDPHLTVNLFSSHAVDPEVARALGVNDGRAATIAVNTPLTTDSFGEYQRLSLSVAEIPADFERGFVRLWRMLAADVEVAAELLGHPLPVWRQGCTTAAIVSAWDPANPVPVPVPVPPVLSEAHLFAEQCRFLADRLERADTDDAALAPAVRLLGQEAWSAKYHNDFYRYARPDQKLPAGWVDAVRLTAPERPSWADFWPGLEWVTTSDDVPPAVPAFAIGFFGYPESLGVAVVDLKRLPEATVDRILENLVPCPESPSWMQTALRRALPSTDTAAASYQWRTSAPAAEVGRVLRRGSMIAFHAPRTDYPAAGPVVQLDLIRTTEGDVAGLRTDADGSVTPLPLLTSAYRPGDDAAVAVTSTVTQPGARVAFGMSTVRDVTAPDSLVRMCEAVEQTGLVTLPAETVRSLTAAAVPE